MSSSKFQFELEETEGENVFYLSGELDLSVANPLRKALEPVVNNKDKVLIFNLEHLKYIDSTGIGILISVLKVRESLEAEFYVQHVPSSIKRLLDLTGVYSFLHVRSEEIS